MVWTRTGSKMPQGMTPSIIRGNNSAGPDFSNSPLRFLTQTLVYLGASLFDAGYKLNGTGGELAKFRYNDTLTNEVDVPDFPQWHENAGVVGPFPGSPFSARYGTMDTNGTFAITPGAVDTWISIIGSSWRFSLKRPATAATTHYFETRIDIASDSDLSTVIASALIRFEYQRP